VARLQANVGFLTRKGKAMILCNGKPQEERGFGEPTGFTDNHNAPICVGDRMRIRHNCNCEMCQHYDDVEIAWNQEWKAYGMLTIGGRWISGMGIAGGYSILKPNAELTGKQKPGKR
jgi:D-serine deaminase-like pyridoxal phosphate-dependent protein